MTKHDRSRAILAFACLVMGSLQAWDSDVPEAGLAIVILVTIGVALPPVALQAPVDATYVIGALLVSFVLLLVARLISPIPLSGLFLTLVPSAFAVIAIGMLGSRPRAQGLPK